MDWDLGALGLATLLAMAAGFALIAQLLAWRVTHWMWLIAGLTYFVAGLVISEVFFGWATEDELQPNIDGLSFDEVLGVGLLFGIAAVLVTWFTVRHTGSGGAR